MTKTKGGQAVVEQLLADLADITATADISLKEVIFDPRGAHAALVEVLDQVGTMRRRIRVELEPLLERAASNREAASLPERVAALERLVAELRDVRANAPPNNVVPLREPRASGRD